VDGKNARADIRDVLELERSDDQMINRYFATRFLDARGCAGFRDSVCKNQSNFFSCQKRRA
jgi:hypothetical protein